MSNTELKPCPFCGGEAKIATCDWGYAMKEYWAYCSCGCETKKFYSKERVIEKWNTRKPMDNIVEELEEAKEKVAKEDYCRTKHYIKNDCEHKDCFECCAEYLIDIVKAGGVE